MDRRLRLQQARSFQVYYGTGLPADLTRTDIAILEPSAHTPDTVARLRSDGLLVIAYISVMEVPDYDPLKRLLKDEDWLRLNGETIRNSTYGNAVADLRSKRWLGLLSHRIGSRLLIDGYDGLFLDTIGNVEWPSLARMRKELLDAAEHFVRSIRKLYPDHIFIQNNGVEQLCERTYPYIDAVCWENPLFFEPHLSWSMSVTERLVRLGRQPEAVQTMLLFEDNEQTGRSLSEAERLARQHGWLIRVAGRDYL